MRLFYLRGILNAVLKHILSIHEQIEELKSAKRVVESEKEATEFLSAVEYIGFVDIVSNSTTIVKKSIKNEQNSVTLYLFIILMLNYLICCLVFFQQLRFH